MPLFPLAHAAALLALAALAGAAGAQDKPAPAPASAAAPANLKVLVNPGDRAEQSRFAVYAAWKAALEQALKKEKLASPTVTLSTDATADLGLTRSKIPDIFVAPAHVIGSAVRYGYAPVLGLDRPVQAVLVAPKESPVTSLAQAKGKKLGLPLQDSVVTYLVRGEVNAANTTIKRHFGGVYETRYQDALLSCLQLRQCDVVAVERTVFERWVAAGEAVKVVMESKPAPALGVAIVASAMINLIALSRGSRIAFAATATPYGLYLLVMPMLDYGHVAGPLLTTMMIAVGLVMLNIIGAWISTEESSRAHQILAQYVVSVLEAPRQNQILGHSAGVVGRARADRVSAHLAGKPAGDGMRWWVDARGDSLRYDTGIGFDGVAPGLTGGVDWTRGGMVYGVFGGIGRSYVDFGERRGDFEQLDGTLGGFFAWRGESVWVNAQASYTWLRYDVDREIWLGPSKRSHEGSPDGRNLTVGVNAGFEFGDEGFRHGPVVGCAGAAPSRSTASPRAIRRCPPR